jgi:putative transposase
MATLLRRWMGCYRVVYNQALEASLNTKDKTIRYNEKFLKNAFAATDNVKHDWLKTIPCMVRAEAVRDLCKAFESNIAKRKKNPKHTFEMRFKSKKNKSQIIKVESRFIKINDNMLTIFPIISKREIIKCGEAMTPALAVEKIKMRVDVRNMNFPIEHDAVISMDDRGRFYIHVPVRTIPLKARQPKKVSVDTETLEIQERSSCALDPGVRTFMTSYSPDGDSFKIGSGAHKRVWNLSVHIDDLVSRIDAVKKQRKGASFKTRRDLKWKALRMKHALVAMRHRIRDLVRDLHWKSARFLCERYSEVIIPPFETQKMSKRYGRTINSKTVRNMATLSHYTFRQRLIQKAKQLGTTVRVCSEAYTTKTCTCCGVIKENVGGAKVFACKNCGLRGDRDGCAARNIYIRNT